MEETRFMQEFPIMLPEDPDVLGRLQRTCLKGNNEKIVYDEVYEWKEKSDEVMYDGADGRTERKSINKVVGRGIHNQLSRQYTIIEDTLYLCDCGVIIITFYLTLYHSQESPFLWSFSRLRTITAMEKVTIS